MRAYLQTEMPQALPRRRLEIDGPRRAAEAPASRSGKPRLRESAGR